MITLLLIVATACVGAILASALMSWASNRAALTNMAIGAALAVGVLVAALIIALLLTRATYRQ